MPTITIKDNTAAAAATNNKLGTRAEPGFEYDTGVFKIYPDAVTGWNSIPLDYIYVQASREINGYTLSTDINILAADILLTGYSSSPGTVAGTDSVLDAIEKLNGNIGLKADLITPTFTGPITITPSVTYGSAQTPGQTFAPTIESSFATGGTLGFQFTTSVDGRITHLACYSINTSTYTVTIKQGATVITSLAIVGTNSGWQRVAITPVNLPAGTYTCTYTMTGTTTCIYANGGHTLPYVTGSFTINEGYTGSTNMSYISLCDLTFEASSTQTLNATYPSFASNAAASAAGLAVGAHYRQGDFLAVVH